MKKKILSLLLALCLLAAMLPMAHSAEKDDPIIMIAGYTATQLFENPDSDDRELVWNLDFNAVGKELLKELPGLLGGGLLYAATRCNKVLVDAFCRAADRVLGKFALNADGSRTADVGPWPGTAKDFSLAAIRKKLATDDNARYLSQLGTFCRRFEQQTGADNIFIMQYDWRNPTLVSAGELRAFIQEVKALTGSRSVRLFGSSYGGQICAAYLYDYAQEGDVSKVVLEFPALGGSSAIPGLVTGESLSIEIEALTRFIQSYMDTETQLEWLTKWLWLEPLYPLLNDLVQAALLPVAKTWGSLWDLLPASDYASTKAAVLGKDETYAWETYSDRLHSEIMPNMGKLLLDAQNVHGIAVRIVADTGSPHLLNASGTNSDGLLDVRYTTGAAALPLGKHGITQSGAVCADTSHAHLSPGQDIDASAAWLPDHTWFVQGQYHGASYMDPYALELECALMLSDSLNTVFDDPDFPQFGLCRQPSEGIIASFDGETLQIENLSMDYDIKVLAVRAPGLRFSAVDSGKTPPGESIECKAERSTGQSGTYTPITVYYVRYSNGVPILKCKTFDA